MSNKLAKERSGERQRPSFRVSTGYILHYRLLSPETMPRLEAAAKTALAKDRPEIPKQRLETGPGEWRDVENPHDEQYLEALEVWEAAVQQDAGMRFLKLCEEYALIYAIDQEEVAALRAAYAIAGATTIADLSDAQVFLWWIALPTPDDQLSLYAKLFGGLTEEAIQAQKASFLGQLQGAAAPPSA
jgi:hypothetical protein